jgi:hypothetical protein
MTEQGQDRQLRCTHQARQQFSNESGLLTCLPEIDGELSRPTRQRRVITCNGASPSRPY